VFWMTARIDQRATNSTISGRAPPDPSRSLSPRRHPEAAGSPAKLGTPNEGSRYSVFPTQTKPRVAHPSASCALGWEAMPAKRPADSSEEIPAQAKT
jgi:hypothetical protein